MSETSPTDLTAHHRLVPYEDVVAVLTTKRIPVIAQLTLNEGVVVSIQERWSSAQLNSGDRDTLLALLDRLAR